MTTPVAVVVVGLGALVPMVTGGTAGALNVPTEPRSVTAVGGPTAGNMTVKWLSPANANGSTVIRYLLATAVDGGAFGAPVDVAKAHKVIGPCAGVTTCSFRVYATNSAGTSQPSTVATGTWLVPGKPTIGAVTGGPAVGKMSMTVRAPATNGGKAITGYLYDVQVNSAGPILGPFALPTGSPRQVPCSSTNPAGGCKFRVYAVNDVGTSVASAALAGVWNLPSTANISSLVPGRPVASATIGWNGPANTGGLPVTYTYEVSADGGAFTNGASSLPTSPRSAIVECTGTNNCSYRITAHNSKGAAPASAAVSTAFNPPGRVSNLVASVASVANLNLGTGSPTATATWGPPGAFGGLPVTSYDGRVCLGNCDESDPAWASATVVPLGNTNSWLSPCPADQITCSFQIRANNSIGAGPWGVSARMTPFAVTNVAAVTAAPAGNVTVTWAGPAEVGAGIDHIALYRCLTTSGCSNSANWSDTGLTIVGNPQTVTHNCGQGVSCTYRVVAIGSGGAGASASSSATAASGSTLPDAPSALTAATHPTTIGAVDLAWTAPSTSGSFPVTDYVFQRSVNSGAFSAPISMGTTGTTYTDPACGASNACTYKVAAVTAAGTGSYSNTATAEGANVPSAPPNLTATPGTALGAVDVAWQAPVDNGGRAVIGYQLERSLDGGSTWPTSFTLGTSLSYADGACGQGVACTYRVSAINSVGTGPVSNNATATGTNLGAPQSLTATTSVADGTTNLGGVDLSWAPPAMSTFPIASYEFRYQSDTGSGFGAFTAWTSTGTGTGTSFTHICALGNVNTTCRYEVRAIDTQNSTSVPSNQATAAGLTDHVAPAVTVTTPVNNSAAPSATPTFAGTAGNGVGDSATVNVTVKQGASTIRTFTVTRSGTAWLVGPTDWAASSPASLGDGTYTVSANQSDWAGNTGTSTARTFTVDSNAPTITITAPAAVGDTFASSGQVFNSGPILVWGGNLTGTSADAGSGVASVTVSVRQLSSGLYWNGSSFSSSSESTMNPGGTASWSQVFAIGNFPQGGSYTVKVTATDNAGNVSTLSRLMNIDYDPDHTLFVGGTGASDANNGLCPVSTASGCTGRGTGTGSSGPKATIGAAAGLATATLNNVVISGGSYTGTLTLTNASALTLTGGFSQSSILRATPGAVSGPGTTNVVTITGNTTPDATGVIIDASAANRTVTLNQVAINSGTPGTGGSAYGVRALGSSGAPTATVTLNRDAITAQAGGAGTSASNNGTTATGGTNGTNGTGGCDHCGSTGGSPGTSVVSGGAGGSNPGRSGGNNGAAGTSAPSGGAGGAAWSGGCVGYYGGCKGTKGFGGGAGVAGASGASGPAIDSAYSTGFTPTTGNGGGGGAGTNGGGGGGGGAGGGGCDGTFCVGDWLSGGAGGGAGGGGAGGIGGNAGTGAGGSFGIYAYRSTVVTDGFTTITTANGGTGGNGGNGQTGGTGGSSGNGGVGNCTGGCANGSKAGGSGVGGGAAGAAGANGNDGTDGSGCCNGNGGGGGSGGGGGGGGTGGRGGGGAGGPSVGTIVKGGGTFTITVPSATQITIGAGGSGGSGGNNGATGVATKQKAVA